MAKAVLSPAQKALIRRYLLWVYKSTQESFERIERKTTQLMVDKHILASLRKTSPKTPGSEAVEYRSQLQEFKKYIAAKRTDELKVKFAANGKTLHPKYLFLRSRLDAIEAAARYFLGMKEWQAMQELYEREFTRRILESREH